MRNAIFSLVSQLNKFTDYEVVTAIGFVTKFYPEDNEFTDKFSLALNNRLRRISVHQVRFSSSSPSFVRSIGLDRSHFGRIETFSSHRSMDPSDLQSTSRLGRRSLLRIRQHSRHSSDDLQTVVQRSFDQSAGRENSRDQRYVDVRRLV